MFENIILEETAMKFRFFARLIVVISVLGLLSGCKNREHFEPSPAPLPELFEPAEQTDPLANADGALSEAAGPVEEAPGFPEAGLFFNENDYRFGCGAEGIDYPAAALLCSAGELEAFLNGQFSPEQQECEAEQALFSECSERYTPEWFETNLLIAVRLAEPSGSISHAVSSLIFREETGLSVTVQRLLPMAGTDDMAYPLLLLELSREGIPAGCAVDLQLEDVRVPAVYIAACENDLLRLSAPWEWYICRVPLAGSPQATPWEESAEDWWGLKIFISEAFEKGSAELRCCMEPFAVCGTGLVTEGRSFRDGAFTAVIGYMDGSSDWGYALFTLNGRELVLINNGFTGSDALAVLELLNSVEFIPGGGSVNAFAVG